MDFSLSAEQQALADTASRWAAANFGSAVLRATLDGVPFRFEEVWQQLADFGWLGINVPGGLGGSDGTLVDACVIAEQLSRHLAPIPFTGNAVIAAAAGLLMADGVREQVLSDLAAGTRTFALVLDDHLVWPPGSISGIAWEWTPTSSLLVPDGRCLVAIDGLPCEALEPQDLLRTLARVRGIEPHPPGLSDAEWRFLAVAHVAMAACLVGAMAGALGLAVEHAKTRQQFGRPIGSFQAVQHICADMLVDVETSRTAMYGAAWAADNLPGRAALTAAATAKAWACAAAKRVCEAAIQVHGGMGFTWECDVHLFLRSAVLCADAFGGEPGALDTVAADVFEGSSLP
jgi:alkylation response protein AidB-like acyl-CoA dehydrogenase